jgi:hypothetical protein
VERNTQLVGQSSSFLDAVERSGAARPLDGVEEGGGLADQLGVAFHRQRLGRIPMLWQE